MADQLPVAVVEASDIHRADAEAGCNNSSFCTDVLGIPKAQHGKEDETELL